MDGAEIVVTDVRDDGIPPARIAAWVEALGADALVNRKSATWRGLDDAARGSAGDAAGVTALLRDHPTVMKRPVIVSGDTVLVGWGPNVQTALGL
jgi:arsenate reductase